eukprot:3644499-Pleurochrysis_carterae.AAC.1
MASSTARSTAMPSVPGSRRPWAQRRKICASSSAPGSPRSSPVAPCCEGADPPAPTAAPWQPSGCGPTASWPAGRPAPIERGAPLLPGVHALRLLLTDAGPYAPLVQALFMRLQLRDGRRVLLPCGQREQQHWRGSSCAAAR